jgi:hypothetical protein
MKQTPPIIPSFHVDTNLGSSLLQLTDTPEAPLKIKNQSISFREIPPPTTSVWKMFFERASSMEGVGVGVIFVSPCQEAIPLSYKLEFEATNNMVEYEVHVLGLRLAKDMDIEEITVFGDVELIIRQVKNVYQSKC